MTTQANETEKLNYKMNDFKDFENQEIYNINDINNIISNYKNSIENEEQRQYNKNRNHFKNEVLGRMWEIQNVYTETDIIEYYDLENYISKIAYNYIESEYNTFINMVNYNNYFNIIVKTIINSQILKNYFDLRIMLYINENGARADKFEFIDNEANFLCTAHKNNKKWFTTENALNTLKAIYKEVNKEIIKVRKEEKKEIEITKEDEEMKILYSEYLTGFGDEW